MEPDQVTHWERYKHVREEIGREWTNITSRIGWLVTSQAFLFVILPTTSDGASSFSSGPLFPLVPLIGFAASLAVFAAVLAALRRVKGLRGCQSELARLLEEAQPVGRDSGVRHCCDIGLYPSSPGVHFFGALPIFAIPVSLLLGWLHVLGVGGMRAIMEWIMNPASAIAVPTYGVVGVFGIWLWLREVLDRPDKMPCENGAVTLFCLAIFALLLISYLHHTLGADAIPMPGSLGVIGAAVVVFGFCASCIYPAARRLLAPPKDSG